MLFWHTAQAKSCFFSENVLILHVMGHFSEKLRQLMAHQEITQEELEARSGVDRSLISRMLRDRVPSRDQLAGLCAGISTDSDVRAELLISHLRDEARLVFERAGIDQRHVTIQAAGQDVLPQERASDWRDDWPIQLTVELSLIGQEALRSPEMREVVTAWAAQVEAATDERRRLGEK